MISRTRSRRRARTASGFLRGTRGGATTLVSVFVVVLALGGTALVTDHVWLVHQRDTLKRATDAASLAAMIEMGRILEADRSVSDDDLRASLKPVARDYIEINLGHLPPDRLDRAKETLVVELDIDRAASLVAVNAEADMGGALVTNALALFNRDSGPGTMRAGTVAECGSTAVEVVLALDVTASMNGAIDGNLPPRGDNHRLEVVIGAARALVEELRAACDEIDVAVGVVPWDKTVRLPNRARWRDRGWVDIGRSQRPGFLPPGFNWRPGADWAGCVEDRTHDANPLDSHALASAESLSLDLPRSDPFPAFVHPNTSNLDVAPMAASIRAAFPALPADVDTDLERRLSALGDNNWGGRARWGRGRPNVHCTSFEMVPLTPDLDVVDAALAGIDADSLWGGGTLAHVGVTWGRRMLAPSWRAVWGSADDVHPVDPAEREVTKALVLLTDGDNALMDAWNLLPGKLDAANVGVPECQGGGRRRGCRQGEYGSFYSAVGRLGRGAAADGFYYPGWGVKRSDAGNGTEASAEAALSALMERSCAFARAEGVTVYTIGVMPDAAASLRDALVACSGAPATPDADRGEFYFAGRDRESLDRAFRGIARRVLSFRRVS